MQMSQRIAEHGKAVRRVIVEGLLDAAFQPIVDIDRARVAGYETLSRPRLGDDGPNVAELFDAAEQTGALWPLEGLARTRSFAAARGWPADRMLFLNCSPSVVRDRRLIDELEHAIARTPGIRPEHIVLEITERVDHESDAVLADRVGDLRRAGFQIAIDDVGAGGSGLTRMTRLRPSWIKIDRDLISGIDTDADRQRLVEFLVDLAADTGASVIAEGVETAGELHTIARLGVRFVQGYLLGRPGPGLAPVDPLAADLLAELKPAFQGHDHHKPISPSRLPGRVACDRALLGEMQRASACYPVRHASMIDLRGLDKWNLSRGYRAGDLAIAQLADILRAQTRTLDNIFLGHPSDDRFLLLAGDGRMSQLAEAAIAAFELALSHPDAPGVRALLLGQVIEDLASPADLYHLAESIKRRTDTQIDTRSSISSIPFGRGDLRNAA